MTRPYLPAEPLVRAWSATGQPLSGAASPALVRAYWKASLSGRLTAVMADRLAVELLGVHPCEVWPEWFEVGIDA